MAAQLLYTIVVGDPLGTELEGLAAVALYAGNWSWRFGAVIPDALGTTWSLAVEEQFYLTWPLLLLVVLRRSLRLLVGVMVSLIAVAVVSRIVLWRHDVPYIEIYVQTEARFDALMIGALLALALHRGWRLPRCTTLLGWLGGAAIVAVALTAHREDAWLFHGGFTLVAAASACLVAAALDDRTTLGRLLSLPLAQRVGHLAYSIYLWHFFVFLAVARAWPASSPLVRLVVGLTITASAAVLSYELVEHPFLRLKDRRRAAPLATTGWRR